MKKILIADPDTGIRLSMAMFLKEHYAVFTASNGPQVLELIKGEGIDLLIMDARVQGIYVFDLLRMVKEMAPDLPVIVMYVYLDETQHVEEYIRRVASACVVKPFKNESLIKTIETLLHNSGERLGGLKKNGQGELSPRQ